MQLCLIQVHATPDLIYKYQISPKGLKEALKADKLKMAEVDMVIQ